MSSMTDGQVRNYVLANPDREWECRCVNPEAAGPCAGCAANALLAEVVAAGVLGRTEAQTRRLTEPVVKAQSLALLALLAREVMLRRKWSAVWDDASGGWCVGLRVGTVWPDGWKPFVGYACPFEALVAADEYATARGMTFGEDGA